MIRQPGQDGVGMADKKTGKKYKYYKGSFTVGKKADGTPERVYVRGKTKAERDDKLAEAKRLHSRGLKLGEMTVKQWGEQWIATYKSDASDTQLAHYKAKLDKDIYPAIGQMSIRDVRNYHLQDLLNAYADGRKGTVQKIRQAVQQLFRDATSNDLIDRNPALSLTLPTLTEKSRRPLTPVERQAVLTVAQTHERGPYVLSMLFCGLRRGECLALIRSDVDLENKRMSITKALDFNTGNIGNLGLTKAAKMQEARSRVKQIAGSGDDEAGARIVPIPGVLLPVLSQLCSGKADSELLFQKADGKAPTQATVVWWWNSFSRQCHIASGAELYRNGIKYETSAFGEDVTPHYLRHTYGTDMLAAGVDMFVRKTFIGHTITDVTGIYTAMSNEAFEHAAKQINYYHNGEKWKPSEGEPEQPALTPEK